jgi:hypothetical protein
LTVTTFFLREARRADHQYVARPRGVFLAHVQCADAAGQRDEPIVNRMTGVGFSNRQHGQTGATPNNIELAPVLAVEFL